MTDRNATDEVVSAFLDGEATGDEAARVRSDPELMRRLDELRVASRAVAQRPEPPPRRVRDAAITGALDAYDDLGASTHRGTDVPSTVRPLVRRRRPGVAVGLSAAAIVALLVLAVPLVALLRDGNDGADLATSTPRDANTSAQDDLAAGDVDDDQEAPIDLGAVDGPDDLRRAVDTLSPPTFSEPDSVEETADEGGAAAATEPSSSDEPALSDQARSPAKCETGLRDADDQLGALRLVATATYRGRPAFVYVFEVADGSAPIHVVARDSCEILTVVPA